MTKSKKHAFFKMNKIDKMRHKAKIKRSKMKKRAKRCMLKFLRTLNEVEKRISEDECDFDFDNSTRPLCSTSEDDSDGPQGSYKNVNGCVVK